MDATEKNTSSANEIEERWLRVRDLQRRYSISRQTVHAWRSKGYLPRATQIGPNAVAWRLSEIEKWESERDLAVV